MACALVIDVVHYFEWRRVKEGASTLGYKIKLFCKHAHVHCCAVRRA